MDKKYTVGDKFLLLRKIKGLKQQDMAAELHIDTKTLSKIENNESDAKIALIEKFCEIINISFEDFMRFNENQVFNNHIQESTNFEVNNQKILNNESLHAQIHAEKEKLLEEKDKRLIEKDKYISLLEDEIRLLKSKIHPTK